MYSRSYSDGTVALPEGYSGTAFSEHREVTAEPTEASVSPREPEPAEGGDAVATGASGFIRGGTTVGGLFSGILGSCGLHMPKIGTEEILILAAAAFLFFSGGGDKECALMLLLLLFI